MPQGFVLSPLLFLIYINDIPNCSEIVDFHLFADDTNLIYADKSLKSLETVVNNDLRNVTDLLNANKLTLNTKKSNYVIFRPSQKKLNSNIDLKIIDNNTNTITSMEYREYVKYLGVHIDSTLSWKHHINYIVCKISKTVGVIANIRRFVPSDALLKIYYSLIFPYIHYGIVTGGQAAKTHMNKILLLQKRVLRFIYGMEYTAHTIYFCKYFTC